MDLNDSTNIQTSRSTRNQEHLPYASYDLTVDPILQAICSISVKYHLPIVYIRDILGIGYSPELNPETRKYWHELIDRLYKLTCGYYVYSIVCPIHGDVFYCGKGRNGRLLDHEIYTEKSEHYNQDVQNRIMEIRNSNQNPVYFLMGYGFQDSESAYGFEREVITRFSLDHLANMRSGISCQVEITELKERLAFLIRNYLSWATKHKWNRRSRTQDMLVLLHLICLGFELGMRKGISSSVREIGLGVGITKVSASKAIHSLMKLGYIERTFRGIGRYSSKYYLTDKVFEYTECMPGLSKCIDLRTVRSRLSHDAFRAGGLNKLAALLSVHILYHGSTFKSGRELSRVLGVSASTVAPLLKNLRSMSLAIDVKGGVLLVYPYSLDDIARELGVAGKGFHYSCLYREESLGFHIDMLKKIKKLKKIRNNITPVSPDAILYNMLHSMIERLIASNAVKTTVRGHLESTTVDVSSNRKAYHVDSVTRQENIIEYKNRGYPLSRYCHLRDPLPHFSNPTPRVGRVVH